MALLSSFTGVASRTRRGALAQVSTASSSFSTSAPSSSRRQVLVHLLQDVVGLGYQSDQILVTPGRARNQLIPTGQARFVPWKRPSDRIARRSQSGVPSPSIILEATQSSTGVGSTPPEVIAALKALPESVDVPHRTTSPSARTIYGSVTLADISKMLEQEFKVSTPHVEIKFKGLGPEERIKELGRYDVEISPKGGEQPVTLRIDVTRSR